MTYHHLYAYEESGTKRGICGFTLLIEMHNGDQADTAMNHLQLHVNEDNLICRSINWQATLSGPTRQSIIDEAFSA